MADAEYNKINNMHAHVAGLKRLSARANAASTFPSTPRKVSFSFAGYGCNVIEHLRKCRVRIERGLTDEEFERIEALFQFTFPPDLRGVLQEGLPVGDGFPNWRSGGAQQLKMWMNRPRAGLLADVERGVLWLKQWGARPSDVSKAVQVARGQLKKVPVLLPIYGHCYVPASPVRAGNPVFYVSGREVYCCGLDVSDFFHTDSFASRSLVRSSAYVPDPVFLSELVKCSDRLTGKWSCDNNNNNNDNNDDDDDDFLGLYEDEEDFESCTTSCASTPLRRTLDGTETWSRSLDALACRRRSNDSSRSVLSPRSSSGSSCDGSEFSREGGHVKSGSISVNGRRGRKIEFWGDLSEKGQSMNAVAKVASYEETEDNDFIELDESKDDLHLASRFVKETVEDMTGRLRRGGWKEEDIAEIVDSASTCSEYRKGLPDRQTVLEGLAFHLDYLSCSLRKAGWSVHDVAETLCFDFASVSEKRRARAAKVPAQVAERIGMLAAFVAQG